MLSKDRKNTKEAKTSSDEALPLISISEGKKAIILRAIGGFGLIRRLAEMGLTPGTEVKILRKCIFGGPVELEARGVTLALGRGVASKILVKPVKEDPHD